jgi:hypothetical protein
MYDPAKIIFEFDDLAICPEMRNSDRRIAVDKNSVRQKNDKSRFLITLRDAKDIPETAKDTKNTYIAVFDDIGLLTSLLTSENITNIIPQYNVRDLLVHKDKILNELTESKDKFNIVINIGANMGDLFLLHSLSSKEILAQFNVIYRVYGSDDAVISCVVDMGGVGIIVDRKIDTLPLATSASVIAKCTNTINNIIGSEPRYVDLFEKTKNAVVHVLSDYDEKDPLAIKSVALGSKFIVLDMPIDKAHETITKVENAWLKVLEFINSNNFNDIFCSVKLGLISK